jgi:hypothetical protein
MAHDMTPAEQHDLVYQAVREIAVRCDGAQSLDAMGFSGVDTKFGRRIAAVPHATWTPEVQLEANKIILKYRQQVLTWTDGRIDVGTLSVVRDAQDNGTNYQGRQDALNYEKRAAVLADRKVDVVPHPVTRKPCLGIFYSKKDPEFKIFLAQCQALPGRKFDWDRKCNAVDVSPQAAAFIQEWDFIVSPAARALLDTLTVAPGAAGTPQAPSRPAEITVDTTAPGKLFIKTDKTAPGTAANTAVRDLPGRWFDRGRYGNQVDASMAVLAFSRTYDVVMSPEAQALCEATQRPQEGRPAGVLTQEDIDMVMGEVSRCGSPGDLPEIFVTMFNQLMGEES